MSANQAKTKAKRHAHHGKKDRGITKPAIVRLARRGGIPRISSRIYEEARHVIDYYLDRVVKEAVMLAKYSKRKTIFLKDVRYVLARQQRPLYGV